MSVWNITLSRSENNGVCRLLVNEEANLVPKFDGTTCANSGLRFAGTMTKGDFTDFIYLGPGKIVCRRNVYEALQPLILDQAQAFELDLDGHPYILLNVINLIDCLDMSRSEVEYFRTSGRLMDIKKYVFSKVCIRMPRFLKFHKQRKPISFLLSP